MVKICSYCSAENTDLNNFCQSCGKQLAQQQPQSTSQNDIVCSSCGQSTSSNYNNCPFCGASLKQAPSSVGQQPLPPTQPSLPPPSTPSKTKGFRWWKLLTWPFTCLGALLTGCCGCCCGACCESSSKSLKEEAAEEVLDRVVGTIFDND
ncbi:MAG: zinc ribbon domain-containing protein [Candidatus Heimdallarchaeota archaeon]|nr:zinc ribbon domain-containing protein [Candidatus Heimdallarchaeota archaeon]